MRPAATIQFPYYQFDGCQLDRRRRPHRFARLRRGDEAGSDGIQNFWEWLVEGLYTFLEGIIGSHLVKRTFWFFPTHFHLHSRCELARPHPRRGIHRVGHRSSQGFIIDHPLFRGANADVNMTFAMALVFFACWLIWALQEDGPVGFLKELFAPKGDSVGLMKLIDGGCILRLGLPRNHLHPVPAILPELSALWQYLRRGKHAGNHVHAGSSSGWLLPVRFIFSSCW